MSLVRIVSISDASSSCIVITAFSSGACCATVRANATALSVPLPGPLLGPSIVRSLIAAISSSLIVADSAAVCLGSLLTTLSV